MESVPSGARTDQPLSRGQAPAPLLHPAWIRLCPACGWYALALDAEALRYVDACPLCP